MNQKHLMVGAFIIVVGLITYQEVRACHDLPWPPRLIATGMVFLFLDLFGAVAPQLAGVMAIGMVLAFLINTLQARSQLGQWVETTEGNGIFLPSACTHNESTSQATDTSFQVQGANVPLIGPGTISQPTQAV